MSRNFKLFTLLGLVLLAFAAACSNQAEEELAVEVAHGDVEGGSVHELDVQVASHGLTEDVLGV